MRNQLLIRLLMGIALSFAAVQASAQAVVPTRHPGWGPDHGRVIHLTEEFHQHVAYRNFSLGDLFRLGQRYNGRMIQSVTVETHLAAPRSALALAINNRVELPVPVQSGRTVLYPAGRGVLGRDIYALDLAVHGEVFITRITIALEEQGEFRPPRLPEPLPPRRPRPPIHPPGGEIVVSERVYFTPQGRNEYTWLDEMIRLDHRHQNYQVERVVLRMRSDYGQGDATLIAHGREVTRIQHVDDYTQEYVFDIRSRLDQDIILSDLELLTNGRLTIEQITVHFSLGTARDGGWAPPEGRPGPPPGRPDRGGRH